jgi:hypothetical protein
VSLCRQLAGQLEAALGEAADLLVQVAAELCDTDAAADADSNSANENGSTALGTRADLPAKGRERQAPEADQRVPVAVTLSGNGTAALPGSGSASAAQLAQHLMGRASQLDAQVVSMNKLLPQATMVSAFPAFFNLCSCSPGGRHASMSSC